MSRLCAVTKCNRASRGLCDCCQQNLCLQHLSEHNASLISELNPLIDEINALGDRLRTLTIETIVGSYRQKLDTWRNDCHEKIDRLFQQKCEELDRLAEEKVKKQQQKLIRLQSRVTELIREQETTRQNIDTLTSTTHHLKEQMDKIEQTWFDINTRPLMIDDSYIQVEEVNELDLSTLPPVCKTINRPDGSKMMIVTNDRFLIMHRNPNLCFVDRELNIVKETLWDHENIYDMCWSSTLDRFIVVEEKHIYLVDDETMMIDNVHTIEERDWLSCTCSETFLFLSTNADGSFIMKFTLLPSIELAKEWKSPHTCARDEIINDIIYNDRTLGMLIENRPEKYLRLQLRSAETLDCIWSLRFDIVCNQNQVFRCCLLACDQWLVSDYESKRLFHVTKDGKLKATIPYDADPRRANVFANMLAVSREGGVNFHKL